MINLKKICENTKERKTVLTIVKITDRVNGYGMPIVEINSSDDIKVINKGWNEFEALQEIDESDLLRLRGYFSSSTCTVMLEINCPNKNTVSWYKLSDVYFGGKGSNIIW